MFYFINRGVSPASPVLPNGNSDPLNLNCYIPAQGQQASMFNSNVDSARSMGGWVIYVVHGFSSSDGSYQPVDIGQMTTAIKYTKSLGDVWVGSMVNVGAYWLGQKAFTARDDVDVRQRQDLDLDAAGPLPAGPLPARQGRWRHASSRRAWSCRGTATATTRSRSTPLGHASRRNGRAQRPNTAAIRSSDQNAAVAPIA